MIHLFSFVVLGSCAHTNVVAQTKKPVVYSEQLTCSEDVNTEITGKKTLLKTFTHDYWKVASNETAKLPVGLRKRGVVVGDFHFNNLGVYYDSSKKKSMLVINDFDDAGENYLVIDLFKFISYLKKVDSRVDLKEVIDYYNLGLQGKKRNLPDRLQEIVDRPAEEIAAAKEKYIRNNAKDFDKFAPSDLTGKQEARKQELEREKEVVQLKNRKFMTQINTSGSSIDMERYLFLGKAGNEDRIIEFKQLKCSGSGTDGRQDLGRNFAAIKNFYQKNFPSGYLNSQRIHQAGPDFYLVREKLNNPLKKLHIPLMATDRVQNYADFFANYLGLIHSYSANASYIRAVNDNKSLILEKAEEISDLFKEIMLEEVNDDDEN